MKGKEKLGDRFTFRVNHNVNVALFAFARRIGKKRADLIRKMLDNFELAYSLLKQHEEQQKAALDGDMTELLLKRFPDVPPKVFHQLAQAVSEVAEKREKEWVAKGMMEK